MHTCRCIQSNPCRIFATYCDLLSYLQLGTGHLEAAAGPAPSGGHSDPAAQVLLSPSRGGAMAGGKGMLHDVTVVSAAAIVVFAPSCIVSRNRRRLVVGGWVHFTAAELHAVLLMRLRDMVSALPALQRTGSTTTACISLPCPSTYCCMTTRSLITSLTWWPARPHHPMSPVPQLLVPRLRQVRWRLPCAVRSSRCCGNLKTLDHRCLECLSMYTNLFICCCYDPKHLDCPTAIC